MLSNAFELTFPLLGKEFPIWLNSLAIWYVVLSGIYELFYCMSSRFKIREYNAVDNKIAIVLDIVWLSVGVSTIAQFFEFTYLYKIMYYIHNFIFMAIIMAVELGILLCMCKYNYSKYLKQENNYKQIMLSIRNNRNIGLICLILVMILMRLYIYLYKSCNLPSFCGILIIVLCLFAKYNYNKVFQNIMRFTKRTISEKE